MKLRQILENVELEAFRREMLTALKSNANRIKKQISTILPIKNLYIIGSVLDKNKFREDSDIDIGILVNIALEPLGMSENLSMKVQEHMINYPINGSVLNTVVFNNTQPNGVKIA